MIVKIWRDKVDGESFHIGTDLGRRVVRWTTLTDEGLEELYGAQIRLQAEELRSGEMLTVMVDAGPVPEPAMEEVF